MAARTHGHHVPELIRATSRDAVRFRRHAVVAAHGTRLLLDDEARLAIGSHSSLAGSEEVGVMIHAVALCRKGRGTAGLAAVFCGGQRTSMRDMAIAASQATMRAATKTFAAVLAQNDAPFAEACAASFRAPDGASRQSYTAVDAMRMRCTTCQPARATLSIPLRRQRFAAIGTRRHVGFVHELDDRCQRVRFSLVPVGGG